MNSIIGDINNMESFPYKIQVIHDQIPELQARDLMRILEPREAVSVNLSTGAYYRVAESIGNNLDGPNRITCVVVHKESGEAIGLSTFLRKHPNERLTPLLNSDDAEIKANPRKAFFELQYCVRRRDFRGKFVGELALAAGLEAVREMHVERRLTKTIWLFVAGDFKNEAALRLYFKYRFSVAGAFRNEHMVMVMGVVEEKIKVVRSVAKETSKAILESVGSAEEPRIEPASPEVVRAPQRPAVQTQTEVLPSTTTLPAQDRITDTVAERGATPDTERTSADENADDSADETDAVENTEETDADGNADESIMEPSQSTTRDSDTQDSYPRSPAERNAYSQETLKALRELTFRKFADHLRWSAGFVSSFQSQNLESMATNIVRMVRRVHCAEDFSFFQHLELGRQIEHYASTLERNTMDVLAEVAAMEGVSCTVRSLKEIVRCTWAVYRYPILGQSILSWRKATQCLPKFARVLDALAEDGTTFPDNVLEAQADRHSVCARISIAYPQTDPGDGDGLPESEVLRFHGLYQNDQRIDDEDFMRHYEYLRAADGSTYRCRLVGFDTQESPASRGILVDDIRQPYWRQGKQLLVDLLRDLRNGADPANLTILADCYGIDLFRRILLDLRGVSAIDGVNEPRASVPAMRRFEVAERFLASGFAHPTYCSYVSESLLGAFNRARERRLGAFAEGGGEFVHPATCRRNRYQSCNRSRKRRKPRYSE